MHANFYWLWVVPLRLAFILTSSYPLASAHFLECLDGATIDHCCYYEDCYDLVDDVVLKCSGDHYPADCCDAYGSLAFCQLPRCTQCPDEVAECGLSSGWSTKAAVWCNAPCMEIESAHHEGCNNEVLCSCADEWRDAKWLCKFNDYECGCPIWNAYIECIQPEVEACGNEGLVKIYGDLVQERDEICASVQVPSPKMTTTTATQEATTQEPPTTKTTTTTTQEPPTTTKMTTTTTTTMMMTTQEPSTPVPTPMTTKQEPTSDGVKSMKMYHTLVGFGLALATLM